MKRTAPRPACAGQVDLFTSGSTRAHARARVVCETCPAIEACRRELEAQLEERLWVHGTWVGRLFRKGKEVA